MRHRKWHIVVLTFISIMFLNFLHFQFSAGQQSIDVEQYTQTLQIGRGQVVNAHWSPNNEQVLVNSTQGAWIYTREFEDVSHLPNLSRVIYSPDGNVLAGIDLADGSVHVVNSSDMNQTSQLPIDDYVSVLAFSPSGRYLAAGGNANVWLWDTTINTVFETLPRDFQIFSIAWSPQEDRIALSGIGVAQITTLENNTQITIDVSNYADYRPIKTIWSPGGKEVAIALQNSSGINSLSIWNATDGKLRMTMQAGRIFDLDWNAVNGYIVTAGALYGSPNSTNGPRVNIWDPLTGELVGGNISSLDIESIEWNSSATEILSSGENNVVTISEFPTTLQEDRFLQGFMGGVTALDWNSDGTRIASGSRDSGIRIWNVETGEALLNMFSNVADIWSVAWRPDDAYIAVTDGERYVYTRNAATGSVENIFGGHEESSAPQIAMGVASVAWSPNGTYLASGGYDGQTIIRDLDEGPVQQFRARSVFVTSLSWTPDSNYVLNSGAALWNVAQDQLERVYECNDITSDSLYSLASLSSDGKYVVSGANTAICIWEFETGEIVQTLDIQPMTRIEEIVWRPLHNEIAIVQSNYDGQDIWQVNILNALSGELLTTIDGHPEVQTIAWSPDGTRLATGGRDGIIRIWAQE